MTICINAMPNLLCHQGFVATLSPLSVLRARPIVFQTQLHYGEVIRWNGVGVWALIH